MHSAKSALKKAEASRIAKHVSFANKLDVKGPTLDQDMPSLDERLSRSLNLSLILQAKKSDDTIIWAAVDSDDGIGIFRLCGIHKTMVNLGIVSDLEAPEEFSCKHYGKNYGKYTEDFSEEIAFASEPLDEIAEGEMRLNIDSINAFCIGETTLCPVEAGTRKSTPDSGDISKWVKLISANKAFLENCEKGSWTLPPWLEKYLTPIDSDSETACDSEAATETTGATADTATDATNDIDAADALDSDTDSDADTPKMIDLLGAELARVDEPTAGGGSGASSADFEIRVSTLLNLGMPFASASLASPTSNPGSDAGEYDNDDFEPDNDSVSNQI